MTILHMQRGIHVAGLQEEIVASPEQVLDLMEIGECELSFVLTPSWSSYAFP